MAPRMNIKTRRDFLGHSTRLSAAAWMAARVGFGATIETEHFDVAVYGGTSAGVIAAVQAARMGKKVALINACQHLGGMTSEGLGSTDMGNRHSIGGIAREFYQRIKAYYSSEAAWIQETRRDFIVGLNRKQWRRDWNELMQDREWYFFEPHVAEVVYDRMASEAGVSVYCGERLDLVHGVKKSGTRIASIAMESGRLFKAAIFIDASYEGDLMAKAGVSYAVGRESQATYGEVFAGYRPVLSRGDIQFQFDVDPYLTMGQPSSTLLRGIEPYRQIKDGEGDRRIQAYNFRLVLTDVSSNRVPFSKPRHYNPARYELLLRYLQAYKKAGQTLWIFGEITHFMPNRKTDTNNHGAVSTDYVGMNYGYPDGDYAVREKIYEEHVEYTKGLIWFILSDPRVPEHARKEVSRWGWAKDEFTDNAHFPRGLYVREARRMVGEYVMTSHECVGEKIAPESVTLASYAIDSHVTHRYVDKEGHVRNEGTLGGADPEPYPVSYRSLVPKRTECTNLLVPVCLSASHAGYGSIRLEPVFMMLGQSAGTAAVIAADSKVAVQDVPYPSLRKRLLNDHQLLDWSEPVPAPRGVRIRTLPGIVVGPLDATTDGYWTYSGALPSPLYVGQGFLEDHNSGKSGKSVQYEQTLPSGQYEVNLSYSAGPDRANNVPVTIRHADGETRRVINETSSGTSLFVSLGTFRFSEESPAVVFIDNAGTTGQVTVGAVQFLPK